MVDEKETTDTAARPVDVPTGVGDAIYQRRSVRRFDRARPVPAELLDQVLDAARWAPSSCNLQTWDFIVVDDEAVRQELSAEVRSVLVAPVSVFVVYDRELAKEGLANVQSASAAVMSMLLRATSLGLASLWVNALGDRDRVRGILGVPDDFELLALVCFGFAPPGSPPPAPDRRPLDEVVHRNRYRGRGALPRSPDPDDWSLDEIGLFFKRKLQSGTRYNKPRASFLDPVIGAIRRHVGEPSGDVDLLDVLSGTGVFTEAVARSYPEARLAVMESTADNHFFANRRCGSRLGFVPFPADRLEAILDQCAPPHAKVQVARESGGLPVMPRILPRPAIADGGFDVALITFRLEGIPQGERSRLLGEVVDRLKPGGRVVVTYTSRRSWHLPAYAIRRRLGRKSVETSPVPEPNIIGPYEAISPGEVARLARDAGLRVASEIKMMPLPDLDAIGPRLDRAGGFPRLVGRVLAVANALLKPIEPLLSPIARVRSVCLTRD